MNLVNFVNGDLLGLRMRSINSREIDRIWKMFVHMWPDCSTDDSCVWLQFYSPIRVVYKQTQKDFTFTETPNEPSRTCVKDVYVLTQLCIYECLHTTEQTDPSRVSHGFLRVLSGSESLHGSLRVPSGFLQGPPIVPSESPQGLLRLRVPRFLSRFSLTRSPLRVLPESTESPQGPLRVPSAFPKGLLRL